MQPVPEPLLHAAPPAAFSASNADAYFMNRAIDLAWKGAGTAAPNPMVGAIVVRDGAVVGEGQHLRCGGDHAEVVALDAAGESARGATLYASLEPCVHHGRTPPCVDRIIAAGVARVVIAALDPDVRVSGRGAQTLRAHGIHVTVGVARDDAIMLNASYYQRQMGLDGTVTLKMAVTMDGRIASAPGRRDEITNEASRKRVHRLRALHDCVVVGINTLLADRPRLDCRMIGDVRTPFPVVLDQRLSFPTDYHWIRDGRPFCVVTSKGADAGRRAALEQAGATVLACDADEAGLRPRAVIDALRERGFRDVFVEGGGRVFTSFLDDGCWDGLYLFQAPVMFGEEGVPLYRGRQTRIGARAIGFHRFGGDSLRTYMSAAAMNRLDAALVDIERAVGRM